MLKDFYLKKIILFFYLLWITNKIINKNNYLFFYYHGYKTQLLWLYKIKYDKNNSTLSFLFLILIITPKTNSFISQMSIGDLLKDDRYQIVRRLAKGSQGVVFLVDDLKTKEK